MLTVRQRDLLLFIDRTYRETGVIPSFDEMKDALGCKSKSDIFRLVEGLEERGYIRRLPKRARAIEITPRGKAYLAEPAQMARAA